MNPNKKIKPFKPMNKRIEDLEDKLDEILNYVKPVEPEIPDLTMQQKLDNALAQVEALKQTLIDKVGEIQNQMNPIIPNEE